MSHSDGVGTVLPHEIDELTHYIFHNYSSLMTVAEKGAYKALMVERKAEHASDGMKTHLRVRFGSSEPKVVRLLDGGARESLIATRDRLLRDHADEVFLKSLPEVWCFGSDSAGMPLPCLQSHMV